MLQKADRQHLCDCVTVAMTHQEEKALRFYQSRKDGLDAFLARLQSKPRRRQADPECPSCGGCGIPHQTWIRTDLSLPAA